MPIDQLLAFLYPLNCLSCSEAISDNHFCIQCLKQFEVINPKDRCKRCFCEKEGIRCQRCSQRTLYYYASAAAFEYQGPAADLVQRLKFSHQPYLAKGMAAFMAAQWAAIEWPLPEYIVPVPISRWRAFDRGYNQSLLLAQELSKIIKVPVKDILLRKSQGLSQASLPYEKRILLNSEKFSLKKDVNLKDSTILLVDDVQTTGSTLNACSKILLEGCPFTIYALTFCA